MTNDALRRARGRRSLTTLLLLIVACALAGVVLGAHGVSSKDARYLQSLDGPAVVPLLYLGAKHMVTGYDHLLFLVGVIFFLYRLKDILLYVSLFTIGHSLTLLAGALGGIHANAYLVDAVIGLSIVYKAFENMGGFKAIGIQPEHARRRCWCSASSTASASRRSCRSIRSHATGSSPTSSASTPASKIGQFLALTAVLLALGYWRTRRATCATRMSPMPR